MRRLTKDYVEISDHTSLDMLIETLISIRDSLPDHAQPYLKLKGDDVFGRRLSIGYFREISMEQAAIEARYEDALFDVEAREVERLQRALDQIPSMRRAA